VFFATGFLGAYTTFSTMAVETVTLIRNGDAGLGFLYLATSMTFGLVAAYAGVRMARITSC
jgi:CrcB protein